MPRIASASDAQKRFGALVDTALREPVLVQRHGRTVVLIDETAKALAARLGASDEADAVGLGAGQWGDGV